MSLCSVALVRMLQVDVLWTDKYGMGCQLTLGILLAPGRQNIWENLHVQILLLRDDIYESTIPVALMLQLALYVTRPKNLD